MKAPDVLIAKPHRAARYGERLIHGICLLLAMVFVASVAQMKFETLTRYGHMSDLFTWDQVLQETASGNVGLEYTYGNQLGEHAYLVLLLMVPFKVLLGKDMVFFLSLLGPIVFGVTGVLLYAALRGFSDRWVALLGRGERPCWDP